MLKNLMNKKSGRSENWHRKAIGGLWDEIGPLELKVLCQQGLQPQHNLLDIGCGALRGGVNIIPYLESGHYIGIEKEKSLIDAALGVEVPKNDLQDKNPKIYHVENLNIDCISEPKSFDYMLAWSVWTHMTPDLIELCVKNIAPRLSEDGKFLATFCDGDEIDLGKEHSWRKNERGAVRYPFSELQHIIERHGFQAQYIGDIGHPRGQKLLVVSNA